MRRSDSVQELSGYLAGAAIISGLLGWVTKFVQVPQMVWRYAIPGLCLFGAAMEVKNQGLVQRAKGGEIFTAGVVLLAIVGFAFQAALAFKTGGFTFGERIDLDLDRSTSR